MWHHCQAPAAPRAAPSLQDTLHLLLHSRQLAIPGKIQAIPAPLKANIPRAVTHTAATAGHPELLLSGNISKSSCECVQNGVCVFTTGVGAFISACPLQPLLQEQPGMRSSDSSSSCLKELQQRLQSAAQQLPVICGVIPSQFLAWHPQVSMECWFLGMAVRN